MWPARLQVDYPMLFRLTNRSASGGKKVTHCGVMEFSAAEGVCYMPHWVSKLPERACLWAPERTSARVCVQNIAF